VTLMCDHKFEEIDCRYIVPKSYNTVFLEQYERCVKCGLIRLSRDNGYSYKDGVKKP